jgi:prepilin-type N-terminal cleavage/methylation domain-containing protein
MRAGFTLIELLFALAFSGVMISTLFVAFFQMNRTLLVAEDIIDFDTRISIMQNQLQKDVGGVFVPIQALLVQKKEAPIEEKKKAAAQKEPKKVLKDVFLSINTADQLTELTFITNNPVRVYAFAKNVKVAPRIVRVVYRLVAEKGKKDSYTLMWQEGTELDLNAYKSGVSKPIRAYALATHIKSIAVEFKAPKEKEEIKTPQKKQLQMQEEPIEFITSKEWRFDHLQKEKKIKIPIPQWVTFKIVLWDNQHESEREVAFTYNIVGYDAAMDQLNPPAPKPEPEKKKAADEEHKKEKAQGRITQASGRPGQKGRTIVLPSPEEIKASVQQIMSMMNN